MHSQSIRSWQHDHVFLGENQARNERRTWMVIGLTAATMVVEIAAGFMYGSMALLADGIHMATHAGAFFITIAAYVIARRYARNRRFTFGTGKVGELAGYSSAMILLMVAALVAYESVSRLFAPVPIQFAQSILVAFVGLAVNAASAVLLHGGSHQGHGHGHGHSHGHGHGHGADNEDYNLRAAYFHVLADALTSLLAISGLLAGRFLGWFWMDPLVGIAGAVLIGSWAVGLLRGAGSVLLDALPAAGLETTVRRELEQGGDLVTDLHLWRVGPGHTAMIVSIVSDHPQEPEHYKARLGRLIRLSHMTVEVNPCRHAAHSD